MKYDSKEPAFQETINFEVHKLSFFIRFLIYYLTSLYTSTYCTYTIVCFFLTNVHCTLYSTVVHHNQTTVHYNSPIEHHNQTNVH